MNDDQNRLIDQVSDRVLQRILIRAARDLSDADLDRIDELNRDDPDGKKVKKFLTEKVPELESIIFQEMQELKKTH